MMISIGEESKKMDTEEHLEFLNEFPKDGNGLFIVYDRFTFDNLFRLLLKGGLGHEDALSFILANCSLSALVFQDRIHNERYRELSSADAMPACEAARRAIVINDLMQVATGCLQQERCDAPD